MSPNIRCRKNVIKANVISPSAPIIAKNSTLPSASTTNKGVIRIATEEEAIAGVNNATAITPETLRTVTNYVFEQSEASDTWIINHNLNKKPSVTLVDTAGTVFMAQIDYDDENTCTIHINGITKGKAYLN